MDRPLTEAERQRVLQVMAATIMLDFVQFLAPPDTQPPMANAPPDSTPPGSGPPGSGGPPPGGPDTSPEPASVITGLLGSGLAGLLAYARKRRQRRRLRLDLGEDVKTDGLELAMAA
jgi:hypothetical protein